MVPGDLSAQCPLRAVAAPGMLVESYREGARQMASCSECDSCFVWVIGLLIAIYPSGDAQHPVLWSESLQMEGIPVRFYHLAQIHGHCSCPTPWPCLGCLLRSKTSLEHMHNQAVALRVPHRSEHHGRILMCTGRVLCLVPL